MSRLVGSDSRYFEVVPHAEVRGENVLAEFVYSISERGWIRRRDWDFVTVHTALLRYEEEQWGGGLAQDAEGH